MRNPFRRYRELILTPNYSKTITLLVTLIILTAIPLTVFIAQKQQETRQHAATSSCPVGNYGTYSYNCRSSCLSGETQTGSTITCNTGVCCYRQGPTPTRAPTTKTCHICGMTKYCGTTWNQPSGTTCSPSYSGRTNVKSNQAVCSCNASSTTGNCGGVSTAQCKPAATTTVTPTPTRRITPTPTLGISDCTSGCFNTVCIANSPNQCGAGTLTRTCTLLNGNSNCRRTSNIISCTAQCANGTCNNGTCTQVCQLPNTQPHLICGTNGTCQSDPSCGLNIATCSNAGQSCVSTGQTQLAFTVGLPRIGKTGDQPNPTNFTGNTTSPRRPTRTLDVKIFDSTNAQAAAQSAQITFNVTSGKFEGTVDLPSTFNTGYFTVKITSPGNLVKQIAGTQSITKGRKTQMPVTDLIAGDFDGNNRLDLVDYSIIESCISNKDRSVKCNSGATFKALADLDDNGILDIHDYNLWIREYSIQYGQ